MNNWNVDTLLKSIFSEDNNLDIRALFDEKINTYGVSKTKVLKLLNIDKDVFEQILNGKAKQPNLIHVVKIANFLEMNVDSVISALLANQSSENISSLASASKATFLLRNFDVKKLTKLGFFDGEDTTEQLVQRVLDFFGYQSIIDFEENLVEPLYSKAKRNFSDKMKDFWIKSAYQTFQVIANPNEYDREGIKDLVVKLKPYSQDVENGLYIVCRALYSKGVTVIFQDYLSTTSVKGATFIINEKPCIVLTDYNKKYPTIWFTLLHELHHVLFDYDIVETNSFHLTGDEDLFLIEEKADSFARDYFMSKEKFIYLKQFINNPFLVNKFAKENEIHVSMAYSFYSWYQLKLNNKNVFGLYKKFFPNYALALSKLKPISWSESNLKESSLKIKSILEINN